MPKTTPSPEGQALHDLRVCSAVTQGELAAALGTSGPALSELESGKHPLDREKLEEAAAALGRDADDLEQALWNARLLLPPRGEDPGWPGELAPGEEHALDRAVARLLRRAAHKLETELRRYAAQDLVEQDRREAAAFCAPLRELPVEGWRGVFEILPYRITWAVCEWLAYESEHAAPHRADQAVELAELALELVGRVPGAEHWRERLRGFCGAFVANSRRVSSDLPGADAAFAEAWRLWDAGGVGERGPLDPSRLLDLEASLRRAQRRFSAALDLLDRALARHPRGIAKARILLKQGNTFQQRHDYEPALAAYEQATQLMSDPRDPRFLFALLFNRSVVLCYMGRLAEAEAHFREAKILADRLRLALNDVRIRWLEGTLAAGHGRMEEALAALEEVRQKLVARGLDFDVALVTLEMAVLLAERGHTSEVRSLAQRTAPLFRQQAVDREALACFVLFQQAAAREAVTAELARGLIERLKDDARRR